jgi:hypothetical protein
MNLSQTSKFESMLNGRHIGQLRDIIEQHYSITDLDQLLLIRLEKRLDNYAPTGGIRQKAFTLINQANMEGWEADLVDALIAERPRIKLLHDFACEVDYTFHLEDSITGTKLNRSGLQSMVNADPLFDPAMVLQGIADKRRTVARIEIMATGTSYGTGFLVGPDLLLTNYHVLETLITAPAKVNNIKVRFDYEVSPDGHTVNGGTEIGLSAANPVIAYSPYTEWDKNGIKNIDDIIWPEQSLDYALVRLSEEIGKQSFGVGAVNASSEKRGWITPGAAGPINAGSHLIIFQHPDRQPVKISFGLNRVLGCDQNNRRVRHQVNTLNGSSGSPCFDHRFNWVAMHNMGDPSWNATYNQGIPAAAIVADLSQKGINL